MMIPRATDQAKLQMFAREFPVTAILGPRQSGKTTIAHQLGASHYFDLENPVDQTMLSDAKLALDPLC